MHDAELLSLRARRERVGRRRGVDPRARATVRSIGGTVRRLRARVRDERSVPLCSGRTLMSATRIHRRTLLRGLAAGGIAVGIPLPRLGAMLNDNGTAYAAGTALPQRFGLWFFGNGILFPQWNPSATGTGASWSLSQELAPLVPVKS